MNTKPVDVFSVSVIRDDINGQYAIAGTLESPFPDLQAHITRGGQLFMLLTNSAMYYLPRRFLTSFRVMAGEGLRIVHGEWTFDVSWEELYQLEQEGK